MTEPHGAARMSTMRFLNLMLEFQSKIRVKLTFY